MENPGFCTTRSHCHNGSLVPPAIRTCKEGEQCCVPLSSKRKSRGKNAWVHDVTVLNVVNCCDNSVHSHKRTISCSISTDNRLNKNPNIGMR